MRDDARQVIRDIDKLDGGNPPAVVDYVEDIYKFYKSAEVNNSRLFSYRAVRPVNCDPCFSSHGGRISLFVAE